MTLSLTLGAGGGMGRLPPSVEGVPNWTFQDHGSAPMRPQSKGTMQGGLGLAQSQPLSVFWHPGASHQDRGTAQLQG